MADDSDPVVAGDLDLEGHGPALVTGLFLNRRDGVRITELADALREAATADLAAEEADRQWQDWVDAHGDPLQLLLGQLERPPGGPRTRHPPAEPPAVTRASKPRLNAYR